MVQPLAKHGRVLPKARGPDSEALGEQRKAGWLEHGWRLLLEVGGRWLAVGRVG